MLVEQREKILFNGATDNIKCINVSTIDKEGGDGIESSPTISNLMKKSSVKVSFFKSLYSRSLLPIHFLFKQDFMMVPPKLLLSIPYF